MAENHLMTDEEKLEYFNDEIGLRILFTQAKSEELKEKIKKRIKEVTKGFIRCRWCGRTFGTLIKEYELKDGEEVATGFYKHVNCEKDTTEAINNYVKNLSRK